MFCTECSSENPDDARLCGACGKDLNDPQKAPPSEQPEPEARMVELDQAQTAVSAGLKWGVLAASLLVPLVGLILGLYFMLKGENEDKKAVGRLWLSGSVGIAFIYFLIGSGGI